MLHRRREKRQEQSKRKNCEQRPPSADAGINARHIWNSAGNSLCHAQNEGPKDGKHRIQLQERLITLSSCGIREILMSRNESILAAVYMLIDLLLIYFRRADYSDPP